MIAKIHHNFSKKLIGILNIKNYWTSCIINDLKKQQTSKPVLQLVINYKFNGPLKSDQNPDQLSQQVKKLIQAQKQLKGKKNQLPILKDISEVKSIQQLDQIYRKFTFMSKQHRQIAVRYLLSGIYENKIQYKSIQDKKMEIVLKQFPSLKLQAQIFQVNHLLNQVRQIKQNLNIIKTQNNEQNKQKQINLINLFNRINDIFYNAFNSSLKNVPKEQINKSKAILYKYFAQYNFQFLFSPEGIDSSSIKYQQNVLVLKKARQFLIESLVCHKQILLNEYKKLDSDEMNKLQKQDNQRHQIKINAIKQNIRKIVQSIGECLYAYFKVINKQYKLVKNSSQFKNRKIELLSLIELHLPLFSIIPGIRELSLSYYKLYKIKIEAKYTTLDPPKNIQQSKNRIKQIINEYSHLLKECKDCLDESIKMDRINSIKQISTTIISISYMMERTAKKDEKQIKNKIAQMAKIIIDKVKKQWKQPLQTYLLKIIKDILQLK